MERAFIEEVLMSPAPRLSMIKTVIVVAALLAPGCSGDSNRPIPDNDVPAIASLDPGYAVEGQAMFNLFVHGQGFNMDSVVRWNGSDRVTTLTNPSPGEFVLRASIHALDVAAQTTAQITVFNPPPGGGVSNTADFVVYDPAALHPTISSVSPSSVTHGQDVTITVHGTGFVSGSTVIWTPPATTTGYTEAATFVNSTELNVLIPAAHLSALNLGSGTLEVVNPAPGGGTSNPKTLTVF